MERGTVCLFLVVFFLLGFVAPSDATITFIESRKTFHTKPDQHLGQPLLGGYDYMGRLQVVRENPTLCPGRYPDQAFDIVTPSDGIPVALVAQSGGCSIFDKVRVASSMINPKNTVGYLIVQDMSKRHLQLSTDFSNNKTSMGKEGHGTMQGSPLDDDGVESFLVSLESTKLELAEENGRALFQLLEEERDASSNSNSNIDDDEEAFSETTSQNTLALDDVAVNLAVLHVTFATGQSILDELEHESTLDRLHGGTRVLLNAKENPFSAKTVVFWMLVTFSCCACGCACLLICFHTSLEEEAPEPQVPRRPTRRKLTLIEVRARFPSYHFDPEQHANACCPSATDGGAGAATCDHDHHQQQQQQQHGYMEVSDECTICLDEFDPGARVRQLPCGHVFHSTCIARWLIERHAVCPLCKLDLYIEPEEDEDDDINSEGGPSDAEEEERPLLSILSRFLLGNTSNANTERYMQLEVPSGAPTDGLEGEGDANNAGGDGEPRSWWPFSVETASLADEEENDDENDGANRQPSSISAAATALSSRIRNVFGSRRRRQQQLPDETNLTELTEPLMSQASTVEEPQQQQQQQQHPMLRPRQSDGGVSPTHSVPAIVSE